MIEVEGTAEFCKGFNDAFDLCNCRNKLSKGDFSFPVNKETLSRIKMFLYNFKFTLKVYDTKVTQLIPMENYY